MSKPPKIDRKSLRTPDEFVQRGTALVGELFAHRVGLVGIVGVALVAVLGFYGYQWYTERHAEQSWKTYTEITKAPESERVEKFKKFFGEVNWSRPRYFAAVAVADDFYDTAKKEALKAGGDPTKAATSSVEWYTKSLDFGDLLAKEKQLILVNRGEAQEIQKKYDEAIADYQKAADLAPEGKPLALLNLARGYGLKGDAAKATQTYEKISIEFANTEYAKLAKNYLRRLKSPLFKAEPKKG